MEHQGQRLGVIAIAIGMLALGFALGSRTSEPRWQAYGPPPGYYQQAPGYQQQPGYGPGFEQQPRAPGYQQQPGYGPGYGPYGQERGHHGRFMAPFFFIGGLLKLALLGGLIFAALRFFRGGRRPWGGPPWGRGGPGGSGCGRHDEGEQERKSPEQPASYTGGTTRL